jgi:glycosyltransferase involved in cell wall biosynthesis
MASGSSGVQAASASMPFRRDAMEILSDQRTRDRFDRRESTAQAALAAPPESSLQNQTAPKVTVVIAAYDAERYIGETLASVLAQSLHDIEVIVVDDGSTDGTQRVLNTFCDRRLRVLRQENSGVSAARNAGLALSRAPHIFFLDADDVLLQDALLRMVDVLDKKPERVACFAHHIRIAEDGSELSQRADLRWKMFPANDTLRHLVAKNFIVCGAICIRTEAARLVRGFSPGLKWGEDWEFWCRLAVLGDFAAMPDEVVLMYRQHCSSANFKWRNSPLRPDFKAIDAVYSNPAVRQCFSPAGLKRRRRLAQIDAFWAAARNAYVQGRTVEFLTYMVVGVLRYPDSILRPGLVYLFLRGLRRHSRRPADIRSIP